MKTVLAILFYFTLLVTLIAGGSSKVDYSTRVYQSGEVLVYKVKWTFVRVGTLRSENLGLVDYEGKKLYKLKFYIDSSPGLPFVSIHDVYTTYVNEESVPAYFLAHEKKGDHVLETEYKFSPEESYVLVRVNKLYPDSTELIMADTVEAREIYRDVLSLLFYARSISGKNLKNHKISTFVLTGKDSCMFEQTGLLKQVKVQGAEVPSYYVAGRVKFIGIAGIKDDFQGWFSIDPSHVPLKAKMKAFFGSVTLELEYAENWMGHKIFYSELMEEISNKEEK